MWISGGTTIATTNTADGSSALNLAGLSAGNYQVFFTDANGCSATCTAELTEPTSIPFPDMNLCVGSSGGGGDLDDITLDDTEAKENNYKSSSTTTYSSSDTTVATIDILGNVTAIAPGVATITRTDMNGCTTDASVTVHGGMDVTVGPFCAGDIESDNSEEFLIDIMAVPAPGIGEFGVWFSVSPSLVFTNVNPATGMATLNYTNLMPGRYPYFYTFTDSFGASCVVSFELLINVTPQIPNITITECDTFRLDLAVDFDDSIEDPINKSLMGFVSSDPSVASVVTVNPFLGIVTGESPGTATITYTDPFGCIDTSQVTVTEKDFSCTITPTAETMCGANDGQLMVNASNGEAPFNYSLDLSLIHI